MSELNLCRLCGGMPKVHKESGKGRGLVNYYQWYRGYAKCENCGCRTEEVKNPEAVIKAWNKQHAEPAPPVLDLPEEDEKLARELLKQVDIYEEISFLYAADRVGDACNIIKKYFAKIRAATLAQAQPVNAYSRTCCGSEVKLKHNGIGDCYVECEICGKKTSDENCEEAKQAFERWDALCAKTHTVIAELVEALKFYRYGFEPRKSFKHMAGFDWKPTEQLLDDCGNKAMRALANYQAHQGGWDE